jgi:hypothetical protein
MSEESTWTDPAFDAAVRNTVAAPDDLAALVSATRLDFNAPVDPVVATRHIAKAAAESRRIAVQNAPAPTSSSSTAQRRRLRRLTFAGAFSGFWAKIAMGAVAVAAVGTGAAATESLPDPLQGVVSDVAGVVGVEIPHPDDPKTVGPEDPGSLPPGGGASVEGRNQGQEQQDAKACREAATTEDEREACDRPVPPGQDPDFVPPGQDPDFVPPGQDPDFVPPGQDPDFVPPGQDPDFVPPGQDEAKDKPTPPGQDEPKDKPTPPGQDEPKDKPTPPGKDKPTP